MLEKDFREAAPTRQLDFIPMNKLNNYWSRVIGSWVAPPGILSRSGPTLPAHE